MSSKMLMTSIAERPTGRYVWRRCRAPGYRLTLSVRTGCLCPRASRHFIQMSIATSPFGDTAFSNSLKVNNDEKGKKEKFAAKRKRRRQIHRRSDARAKAHTQHQPRAAWQKAGRFISTNSKIRKW